MTPFWQCGDFGRIFGIHSRRWDGPADHHYDFCDRRQPSIYTETHTTNITYNAGPSYKWWQVGLLGIVGGLFGGGFSGLFGGGHSFNAGGMAPWVTQSSPAQRSFWGWNQSNWSNFYQPVAPKPAAQEFDGDTSLINSFRKQIDGLEKPSKEVLSHLYKTIKGYADKPYDDAAKEANKAEYTAMLEELKTKWKEGRFTGNIDGTPVDDTKDEVVESIPKENDKDKNYKNMSLEQLLPLLDDESNGDDEEKIKNAIKDKVNDMTNDELQSLSPDAIDKIKPAVPDLAERLQSVQETNNGDVGQLSHKPDYDKMDLEDLLKEDTTNTDVITAINSKIQGMDYDALSKIDLDKLDKILGISGLDVNNKDKVETVQAVNSNPDWEEITDVDFDKKCNLAKIGVEPVQVDSTWCVSLPSEVNKANLNLLKDSKLNVALAHNPESGDVWIAGKIDDITEDENGKLSYTIDCSGVGSYNMKFTVTQGEKNKWNIKYESGAQEDNKYYTPEAGYDYEFSDGKLTRKGAPLVSTQKREGYKKIKKDE